MSAYNSARFSGEGLELFIELEEHQKGSPQGEMKVERHCHDTPTAHCRIRPVHDSTSNLMERVEVADLFMGDVSLLREKSSPSLHFMMVGPLRPYLVDLVWHE